MVVSQNKRRQKVLHKHGVIYAVGETMGCLAHKNPDLGVYKNGFSTTKSNVECSCILQDITIIYCIFLQF